MNSIERAKADIARLEGVISAAREQTRRAEENLKCEQERLDKLQQKLFEDRRLWQQAIDECKRKKGLKAVGLSPRALAIALGISWEMVSDRFISGGVWFHNMEHMEGYEYDPNKGQVSYPCAYFRRRKVMKDWKELRTCLAAINFRRGLRNEPSISFEESRAKDKRDGTKWRRK